MPPGRCAPATGPMGARSPRTWMRWSRACPRERRQLPLWILAALEHIGTVEIYAGAKHDWEHGCYIVRLNDWPSMIRVLDSATDLSGHEGSAACGWGGSLQTCSGDCAHIARDTAAKPKSVYLLGRKLLQSSVPRSVRIASIDRQHCAFRNRSIAPSGLGIKRHMKAAGDGQLLQSKDVVRAGMRTSYRILVLQLDTDDGTTSSHISPFT
jgi:hypothetical protein